jgi:hypothetical protein
MPVILATQEAEIRRIEVRSQSGQIVHEILSWKTFTKTAGGVAQGVGPEFKPQYRKKKKFMQIVEVGENCIISQHIKLEQVKFQWKMQYKKKE